MLPSETQVTVACFTIADAQLALATWTDLTAARAQKMRTALATAVKVLAPSQHPSSAAGTVVMNCSSLSRLLQAPPSTFGLSVGRMTSLCSELRYILRRLDLHEPSSRGGSLLSEPLQACLELLPHYRRLGLLDFLRFIDARGVTPEAVDADVLAAFQARCTERILCADPAARVRLTSAMWNWAHRHVPGWPGQLLPRTGKANRYTLPLEAYPVSFRQDLDQYSERLGGRDIEHIFFSDALSEGGGPSRRRQRPLRASSIVGRRFIVRCAAAALIAKGMEPTALVGLRDLVTPIERAKDIILFFLERRDNKVSSMAHRVAQTLHLLARDHCKLSAEDVAKLATWRDRVAVPERPGLTAKNARRLRALTQPRVHAMLLCLPTELLRRADQSTSSPIAAARLAMYAIAMEILLICPMRRGNLGNLRLDQHLYRPDPRRSRVTHLILEADEVKNGNGMQWPIPLESQKRIDNYLRRHRPHLVAPGNPYLFGIGDKQRTPQFLGSALAKLVTREVGVEFNVHLARHFAAWSFLQHHPGQYEVVRQILGHRSLKVTMGYYVGQETAAAAQHFDRTVLQERRTVAKLAAQAFRKKTGGLAGAGRGRP